jgi:RNA polymerase sigma factor (sigma-70 family)
MSRTDAALLLAARTDPGAFRELYERYAEQLHGFHLRRTADADAAYDLTAETFAQAWLSRARFRDEAGGSAAPWLYGIARNVLLMSVRRRRLERSACERLGLLTGVGDAPVPEERWLDGLDEALAELPEGQRQAVALRFAGDLEYDAVADALGTTPHAARVRVHRAISTLRQRLAKTPESS